MSLVLDGARWLRAQQVFDAVIDLPAAARTAALDAACGGDAELLRMVEGLLAADAQALPDPPSAVTALEHLGDPELPRGTQIGAWQIERTLGYGGMGRVYLGRRADGRVDQQVAIKTIRSAFAGPDLLQRFHRERRILAQLNHPNIARFIDAFECAKGTPGFAMEFVAGTPLLEYAQARGLDLRARLRLFVKIASAVDYAHRQLIVHRDLKPGNVLVDASGEPKLLDFGIAKAIRQHQEQALLDGHTAPEARYLSLRYAAPEQFAGASDSVSIDIYALGALLYELLTGRPPLQLDGLSLAAAQARILMEMPRPPSEAVTQGPYPGASLVGDLDRIVLHALKKEADQRYPSAAALLEDLQCVLEHRPISLRRSHRWYLLARFLRRHRVSAALAGTVLLVLCVSALILYQQSIAVRQQRDEARAVTQFLVETFRSADPAYAGGQARVATLLSGAARKLQSRTDIENHTRRLLGLALAEAALGSGTPSSAANIDVLEIAEDPALSVAERARANRIAAGLALSSDDFDESERRVAAALRDEQDPSAIASLYDYQAKLQQRRGDYAGAAATMALADRELTSRLGQETPVLYRVRLQRAMAMAIAGDIDAALQLAEAVVAQMRSTRQPPVEVAGALRSLVYLLSRADREEDVLPIAEEQLQIVADEYGKGSVAYAGALMQKAAALANTGQWRDAVDLFLQARGLLIDELGADNLAVAKLEYSMATGYIDEGDAGSALPLITHALMVARRTWGELHDDSVRFALIKARALRQMQRHRELVELIEPLLHDYAKSKPDALLRLWLQVDLAEARALLGDAEAARDLLHEIDDLWAAHGTRALSLRERADSLMQTLPTATHSNQERTSP